MPKLIPGWLASNQRGHGEDWDLLGYSQQRPQTFLNSNVMQNAPMFSPLPQNCKYQNYSHSTTTLSSINYLCSHLTTYFLFTTIFINMYDIYSFTFNASWQVATSMADSPQVRQVCFYRFPHVLVMVKHAWDKQIHLPYCNYCLG